MIDEIDAASIIGEIVLLRAYAEKTILILEGGSDSRFFSPFVDHSKCDIVLSHSKQKSIVAVVAMDKKYKGLLAVVDKDLDAIFSSVPHNANIIVTQTTDIEVMMVQSNAFDRLILELGSVEKISSLKVEGMTPRELLLKSIHRISLLRLLSRQKKLNLRFKDLRYNFVDRRLEYGTKDLVEAVLNHSRMPKHASDQILEWLSLLQEGSIDPWEICPGHVLTEFIGRSLQNRLGSHNSNAVSAEQIESRLRLAFSEDQFKRCGLHRDIGLWEDQNHPYAVLNI
jgi:hypothetical protein